MITHSAFPTLGGRPARHLAWTAFLILILPWRTMGALAAVGTDNRYVGSATCATCHADKAAQLNNSIHSKMIRVNAHLPGVIHGDLRKANAPKLPATNDPTNDVHWVIGGHYKEESYIRTNHPGDPYPYTVTEFEWAPISGNFYNNKSKRDWLSKCAGCHTTGFDPATRTFSELNIGCEACHGPGGNHVDNDGDPFFIAIDRSAESCGHCHNRAESAAMGSFTNKQFNFPIGYVLGQPESLQYIPESTTVAASFFPDGTANRHREQFLDYKRSKHYAQGVTCVSCHNPHTSGTVTTYASGLPAGTYGIKIYDNLNSTTNYMAWDGDGLKQPKTTLCKSCHATLADNHVHKFNATAAAASLTCTDCHMPDVINIDSATLRGALTPHTFAALKPDKSMKFSPNTMPNSCTYRCHQDRGADKALRAAWADWVVTPRLETLASGSPGTFNLHFTGIPDFKYAIEVSEDLVNWTPLGTNSTVSMPTYEPRWGFDAQDPSASTLKRFYRAVQR